MRKLILISHLLFLGWSYLLAQNYAELSSFRAIGVCDSVQVFYDKVRPILYEQTTKQDQLNITIRAITNCAFDNLIGAFSIKNDTLNLLLTFKGEPIKGENIRYQVGKNVYGGRFVEKADCDCYAQLEYTFRMSSIPRYKVFDSKALYEADEIYAITEPTHDEYHGEIVNRTDSIGNRQGRWISLNKQGQIVEENYYVDDEAVSTKYIEYFDNGLIKKEANFSDKYLTLEYHADGFLENQCTKETLWFYLLSDLYREREATIGIEIKTCIRYNKQGEVIEKTVTKL